MTVRSQVAGCGAYLPERVVTNHELASRLDTSDEWIRQRTGIVVGAETFSRILDWEDRNTCVLFGDGAGAVVLRAIPAAESGGRFILSNHLHSDGRQYDILYVDGGPSSTRGTGFLRMEGRE